MRCCALCRTGRRFCRNANGREEGCRRCRRRRGYHWGALCLGSLLLFGLITGCRFLICLTLRCKTEGLSSSRAGQAEYDIVRSQTW